MCLYIDHEETKKIQTRLNRDGYIKIYKKINVSNTQPDSQSRTIKLRLCTPYQSTHFKLKNGFFYSDRKNNKLMSWEIKNGQVHKGIHTYRNKDGLENIIVCYGYREDFVAAGHSEIVFTRIQVDLASLAKAQKYFANQWVRTRKHPYDNQIYACKCDLERKLDEIRYLTSELAKYKRQLVKHQVDIKKLRDQKNSVTAIFV